MLKINKNETDLIEEGIFKGSALFIEKTKYSNLTWLTVLPPDLHEKFQLIKCESDELMLMRSYLYSAINWFPFVVAPSADQCEVELNIKTFELQLKTEQDIAQWQNTVRKALLHMEDCFKKGRLSKLQRLNKDWRVSAEILDEVLVTLEVEQMEEEPLIMTVSFYCKYAEDFEVKVELIDHNRMQGLQDGWNKAIEHYCPNDIKTMQKQLKRKLGSIYNFHDQSDIILRFMNADGKRDEIRATTDYSII